MYCFHILSLYKYRELQNNHQLILHIYHLIELYPSFYSNVPGITGTRAWTNLICVSDGCDLIAQGTWQRGNLPIKMEGKSWEHPGKIKGNSMKFMMNGCEQLDIARKNMENPSINQYDGTPESAYRPCLKIRRIQHHRCRHHRCHNYFDHHPSRHESRS